MAPTDCAMVRLRRASGHCLEIVLARTRAASGWLVAGMGKATSYGLVRKSAEGHCSTFSSPTIKSSHVAIAMHLTLCAMLLRCPAMCLLSGVNCER